MVFESTHARRLMRLVLCAASLLPGLAWGQYHEDFESVAPSWTLRETDCVGPRKTWTQRRSNDPVANNRVEQLYFKSGPGTKVLAAHHIPPAFIIPELTGSIRLHANRPGVQVMWRVVLPHTPSPDGQGAMTTMLPASTYRNAGRWETLSIGAPGELADRLQEKIWVLRREFGRKVSQQDAYVDAVVLNLYTDRGESITRIDDLKVDGIVAAHPVKLLAKAHQPKLDPAVMPSGFVQPDERQESLVQRDGSVLKVRERPFFPRIIQHRGESFEFLKSLGFNTVELTTTATEEQLQSAQELDLWIVCPAPPSAGLEDIPFEYDRVLAWSLGNDLTGHDLDNIRNRIREIRESDLRAGRPIVGDVHSHWQHLGTEVDVMNIGIRPVGSSYIASTYSDWIRARSAAIGNSKPIWAEIQTELPHSINQQIAAAAKQSPPTPMEPQQMKFLVYEAIAGGSRGLRYLSRNRLDATDPETRLRALTIRWANASAVQLEPWVVGGALMGTIETGNQLEVTAINTSRSRLLLIQRPTHHEQYWAGDSPLEKISFDDPATTFTNRAYRVTENGLVPLANIREHGGLKITVDDCPYLAAVVLTQDPQVIGNVNQSVRANDSQNVLDLHVEITRQWLAIMQLVDQQLNRMGRATPSSSGSLNEAINAYRKATELIQSGTAASAISFLDRADERLAFSRREIMTEPLGRFASKTSTPFLAHVSLVPFHWETVNQLADAAWNPNGLAGGDFEHLPLMTKHGWQNKRVDDSTMKTDVRLSKSAAVAGQYGLELSVQPNPDHQGLVPATPLWVTSAETNVQAGQMIRIHGWVNVPRVIGGSHDGLMIIESVCGSEMAERIPVTNGWQEFTLYRAATRNGTVSVTFAMTGVGQAVIDEVTIRTVDLVEGLRQAKRD